MGCTEGMASITTVTFAPSTLIEGEAMMSDFHMPDSWYDPPDDNHCEKCDDEGCHLCDRELARAYAAEMRHPERI
jgi:uncharacterized protein YecT (DUF1311 family)